VVLENKLENFIHLKKFLKY